MIVTTGSKPIPAKFGEIEMKMPNFLIIGAAKSGTTALYHALKQHPQIYMSPVKEPRFFTFEGKRPDYCGPGDDQFASGCVINLQDYLRLFEEAEHQIAIGEASVTYLRLSETSSQRIQHYIPHVKLIAVLRQPAERAYSIYTMRVAAGREWLSFAQALQAEEERQQMNWSPDWTYKASGYYYRFLQPYFERFPREQIRIYLYEDWQTKSPEVLQDIFRFLQVDNTFVPEVGKHNVTRWPRSRAIQALLTKPHELKTWLKPLLPPRLRGAIQSLSYRRPPSLDPELHRQLTECYREDILKLQDLIGRDLSHWLKT